MRIFRHSETLPEPYRGAVLCLGNFDGFHRGHQAVLTAADDVAVKKNALLGVLTTEPHPRQYFRPDEPPFRLSSFRTKAHMFEKFGLDLMVALHFDKVLAQTAAEDFIQNILVDQIAVSHLVVGYDYRFGHGRKGTPEMLQEAGGRAGFGLTVVPPQKAADTVYSSSAIRNALREGRAFDAAEMLGHWWQLEGAVIAGRRIGQTLGFPTANIRMGGLLEPLHAIYAVRVGIEGDAPGQRHNAVASFGTRPTIEGGGEPLLEVYLLDGTFDLYDRHLTVELVEYIRPEARFDGLESLKAQIAEDCDAARAILADAKYARDRFTVVRRPSLTGF